MLYRLLASLYRRLNIHSLNGKLLFPIVGLMVASLLGSTFAFVTGAALTQNQLLRQQISADADRVTEAMAAWVETVSTAAGLLANDPDVIVTVQDETEAALSSLNSRAVVVRDRFDLDLIQIYDQGGHARTNLVISSLYRESSLLDQVMTEAVVARAVDGHLLLLSRADMPGGGGSVIVGVDLEEELHRLVREYRLPSDLGLSLGEARVGTRDDLRFDVPDGRDGEVYSRHLSLELGATPVSLLLTRPVTEATRVTTTGLVVMVGSTLLTTLLLVGLGVAITRSIAQPIQRLSSAAEAVAGGNLDQHVAAQALEHPLAIGTDDEIGSLSQAFNDMVTDLRSLYDDLEGKVASRTRELGATAEVARAVSSSLDASVMLRLSIYPLHQQLGFDNVGLFTIDPQSNIVVLREAAGTVMEALKERGVQLPAGHESVVGIAAATGRPQVTQHLAIEPVTLRIPDFPEKGSAAAIPLLAGKSVIGVLYAQVAASEAFTPDLVNLMETLADQIAVGVENTRLYAAEQQRRHLAETLELAGRTLSSSLDLEALPARVLTLLDTLVPYDRGALLLQRGDQLVSLARRGFPNGDNQRELTVPIREGGIFDRIAREGKPIVVNDVTQDEGWIQLSWLPVHHAWLGAPIISKGRVIGMISLTRREAGGFKPEDTTWAQALATQAGIALENASLYAEIAEFNEQLEGRVLERTEELNRAYHILEELDKSKSSFIAVAAHELRTPLTVVKAYAQLLESKFSAEESELIFVEGILTGAERLHGIINNMLDMARVENQTLQVSGEQTHIVEVIERVRQKFTSDLGERRLALTVSGLDDLPPASGDPDLLYKVFYHVVVNAIKFTPDGGRIVIDGRLHTAEGGDVFVEIAVEDTGIGIDPEQLDLIFEKFYQTGEVSTHSSGRTAFKGGGPGLGLAIARGIVLAHGGEIWAESDGYDEDECPGSVFTVRLPVADSPVEVEQLSILGSETASLP